MIIKKSFINWKIGHCFWLVVHKRHFKKQTNETSLDNFDFTLNFLLHNLLTQSLQSSDLFNSLISVSLFYDLISTVVFSLAIFYITHFGSNSNGWCILTLMYLDLWGHIISFQKLFWALWLPFALIISLIWHQYFSCGHIQEGWLQSCWQMSS